MTTIKSKTGGGRGGNVPDTDAMNRTTRRCVPGVAILCAALAIAPDANATEIERVEPPFWWQGFEHRELQLLVHGDGIADFEPSISRQGLSISSVRRVASPNYLFIYVAIDPDANPATSTSRSAMTAPR